MANFAENGQAICLGIFVVGIVDTTLRHLRGLLPQNTVSSVPTVPR
jgi:hypothetical protein